MKTFSQLQQTKNLPKVITKGPVGIQASLKLKSNNQRETVT